MYQVLLVDDEALITDGLAEYLARRAPERFEILKAYSGAGALEIAGRMRVDILVTDIEMLGLDGLAVRRRVQALWPQCRAIFLTAHANFEYAYQAIQDPPARYLLKSEGFERLAQILEQTAAELDEALYNARGAKRAGGQPAKGHAAQRDLARGNGRRGGNGAGIR